MRAAKPKAEEEAEEEAENPQALAAWAVLQVAKDTVKASGAQYARQAPRAIEKAETAAAPQRGLRGAFAASWLRMRSIPKAMMASVKSFATCPRRLLARKAD